MILRKPPVSKTPFDWQLGDGWVVSYQNSIAYLEKLPATAGTAVLELPLPGKYRMKLIGVGLGVTVNGASVSLSPSTPLVLNIDATTVNSTVSIFMSSGALTTVIVEHFDNEFYVEGVTNASLIFDSQDIRTPNKRSAARSRNITVPPTDNNLRALGELFEINHEGDFDPRKRADCHITIDSVTVLSGYAQVISINRGGNSWKEIKSIEVQAFNELSEFFSLLGEKKVSELSFSEYQHNLGVTDITRAGWREDPTEHLVKKGSYVANYNHTSIGSATVSHYVDTDGIRYYQFNTTSAHGLTVGDFVWVRKTTSLSSDRRKHTGEHRVKLVIDANNIVVSTSSAGSEGSGSMGTTDCDLWKRVALGFGYSYIPADLGLDSDIAVSTSGSPFDLGNPYPYPTQAPGTGTYQVTASRMRPSVFLKEVILKAAQSVGFEIVSEFIANNQDFNRIAVLPWHKEGIERDTYNRYQSDGITLNADYEEYNSPIDPTEYLPQVKLTDLIGDVIKMFNFYVQIEDRKLIIEPRDSYFTSDVVDWNNKIDQEAITVKLLPELTAKNYEYTMAKANDLFAAATSTGLTREFGSVTVEAVNEFNTSTVSNKLTVVEPTVIVSSNQIIPGAAYPRRNLYSASSKTDDGKPLRKGVRLVYVSSKGIGGATSAGTYPFKIWKRWASESNGIEELADNTMYIFPAGTHVDSVCWPMYDLNYLTNPLAYPPSWGNSLHQFQSIGKLYTEPNGLYGHHHSRSVRSATSRLSRMISGSGIFTLQDVALLDFRSLVSFDGQLYQLNKFDIDLTSMVGKFELLLMQDLGSSEFTEPIEGVSSGTGKVVESIMSAISDVTHIEANDSLLIEGVGVDPVTVGKPTRPLQELRILTKVNLNLEGKDTLIDGSASPKSIAIGETLMWSRDGIDWEVISTPTIGYSGVSGYSGIGTSGYSGFGSSGYSGYSGIGVSGYSGFSGISPTSTVKGQFAFGANSTTLATSTSYYLGYTFGIGMQTTLLNVTYFVVPNNVTIKGCVFGKSGGTPASTTAELYLVPSVGSDIKVMDLNMGTNAFQSVTGLSIGLLTSLNYALEIRMGTGSSVTNCTPRIYLSYEYNL